MFRLAQRMKYQFELTLITMEHLLTKFFNRIHKNYTNYTILNVETVNQIKTFHIPCFLIRGPTHLFIF